jgi:Type VI secretion system (T6SS), amidase effector protein 4
MAAPITYPPGDVNDTVAVTVIPNGSAAASFTLSTLVTYPPGDVNDTVSISLISDATAAQQASWYARQATGPTFDTLWANHPVHETPPNINPCKDKDGKSTFANQCTIRLGVCFTRSGISLATYPGAFCWHGHGREHPLRVEEMKNWLNSSDAGFVGRAEISRRDSAGRQKTHANYADRKGIAAFRNFWGSGNQGDHIDLWDGTQIARGDNDFFERSEEICFWSLP